MTPASFTYARPGSLDEALGMLAGGGRGHQGHQRRPEPPAAAQAAPHGGGRAHRHRATQGAPGHPGCVGRRRGHRRGGDLRGRARSAARRGAGAHAHRGHPRHRRRAGPQPRHPRRQPRARVLASHFPAAALALDASVVVRSSGGERVIPVDGLFEGAFTSTLAPGELITEIRFPAAVAGAGSRRPLDHPARIGLPPSWGSRPWSVAKAGAWHPRASGSRASATRPTAQGRWRMPSSQVARGDRRGVRVRGRWPGRQRRHPRGRRVPDRDGGGHDPPRPRGRTRRRWVTGPVGTAVGGGRRPGRSPPSANSHPGDAGHAGIYAGSAPPPWREPDSSVDVPA